MKKGITPVLSVVLLIFVTVALIATAFIFFSSIASKSQAGALAQVENIASLASSCMKVEGVYGDKIYIRNCGRGDLTNIAVYADSKPVDVETSSGWSAIYTDPIPENSVVPLRFDAGAVGAGEHVFKISSGFSSQTEKYNISYSAAGFSVSISSPENITYASSDINLAYAIKGNVVQCLYELDGVNKTAAGCSGQMLSVPDGWHTMVVWVSNSTGRWNSSERVNFTIHADQFNISFSYPTPNWSIQYRAAVFAVNASAGSGYGSITKCSIEINGANYTMDKRANTCINTSVPLMENMNHYVVYMENSTWHTLVSRQKSLFVNLSMSRRILLVANRNSPISLNITEYYKRVRGVPDENVVYINTSTNERINYSEFIENIETPIKNHILSRGLKDEILYIVTTKGVPLWTRNETWLSSGGDSVDAELVVLFTGDITTLSHCILSVYECNNPYNGKNTNFETFRKSADNIDSGRQFMDYLVGRLDGYPDDRDADGIPDVVKDMIDRAIISSGRANYALDSSGGLFVLDDCPGCGGSGGMVDGENGPANLALTAMGAHTYHNTTPNIFVTNQQNVIAYSSARSKEGARVEIPWYRPNNTWLPGAIAYTLESYNGKSNERKYFFIIINTTDSPGRTTINISWERKYQYTYLTNWTGGMVKAVILDSAGNKIAETDETYFGPTNATYININLSDVPGVSFPLDGFLFINVTSMPGIPLFSPYENNGEFVFEANTHYRFEIWQLQSLIADLAEEGASGFFGNVDEPGGSGILDVEYTFPRYFSGYNWIESAYMGMKNIEYRQVVVGDPLMVPFASS